MVVSYRILLERMLVTGVCPTKLRQTRINDRREANRIPALSSLAKCGASPTIDKLHRVLCLIDISTEDVTFARDSIL
jgi:hypothetical protein